LDTLGAKFHEDLKRTNIEGKILLENPTIDHKNYAMMTCAPEIKKLSFDYEKDKLHDQGLIMYQNFSNEELRKKVIG
jgi:hypothetical protein